MTSECKLCAQEFSSHWELIDHNSSFAHHIKWDKQQQQPSNPGKKIQHNCVVCNRISDGITEYSKHVSTDEHKNNINRRRRTEAVMEDCGLNRVKIEPETQFNIPINMPKGQHDPIPIRFFNPSIAPPTCLPPTEIPLHPGVNPQRLRESRFDQPALPQHNIPPQQGPFPLRNANTGYNSFSHLSGSRTFFRDPPEPSGSSHKSPQQHLPDQKDSYRKHREHERDQRGGRRGHRSPRRNSSRPPTPRRGRDRSMSPIRNPGGDGRQDFREGSDRRGGRGQDRRVRRSPSRDGRRHNQASNSSRGPNRNDQRDQIKQSGQNRRDLSDTREQREPRETTTFYNAVPLPTVSNQQPARVLSGHIRTDSVSSNSSIKKQHIKFDDDGNVIDEFKEEPIFTESVSTSTPTQPPKRPLSPIKLATPSNTGEKDFEKRHRVQPNNKSHQMMANRMKKYTTTIGGTSCLESNDKEKPAETSSSSDEEDEQSRVAKHVAQFKRHKPAAPAITQIEPIKKRRKIPDNVETFVEQGFYGNREINSMATKMLNNFSKDKKKNNSVAPKPPNQKKQKPSTSTNQDASSSSDSEAEMKRVREDLTVKKVIKKTNQKPQKIIPTLKAIKQEIVEEEVIAEPDPLSTIDESTVNQIQNYEAFRMQNAGPSYSVPVQTVPPTPQKQNQQNNNNPFMNRNQMPSTSTAPYPHVASVGPLQMTEKPKQRRNSKKVPKQDLMKMLWELSKQESELEDEISRLSEQENQYTGVIMKQEELRDKVRRKKEEHAQKIIQLQKERKELHKHGDRS